MKRWQNTPGDVRKARKGVIYSPCVTMLDSKQV